VWRQEETFRLGISLVNVLLTTCHFAHRIIPNLVSHAKKSPWQGLPKYIPPMLWTSRIARTGILSSQIDHFRRPLPERLYEQVFGRPIWSFSNSFSSWGIVGQQLSRCQIQVGGRLRDCAVVLSDLIGTSNNLVVFIIWIWSQVICYPKIKLILYGVEIPQLSNLLRAYLSPSFLILIYKPASTWK
jgi:hypothetical protein